MEVLLLKTEDYELIVRAEKVDESFRKASVRNTNIETSTDYSFNGSTPLLFALAQCKNNRLLPVLKSALLNAQSHPVFFENRDYFFDVVFNEKTDGEPVIYSSLLEIQKAFISRKVKDNYFLTGAINYGNDIGKTRFVLIYKKQGKLIRHILNYEVFPVKMDYKSDYRNIISDINNEFSSLVFDVLKKTYTGFKEGPSVNNDIIWWAVFGELYNNILLSSRLILNKPHNRLVKTNYYSKADRIRFLNYELEEKIAEERKNPNKYYLVERKTLTTNTIENQFFKYAVFYVQRKFISIKNKLLILSGVRITEQFTAELENIEKEFFKITHHPFFSTIDDFSGLKQESLVLQKASGYSALFRSWIILKKGIDFLEGINKIELKNIADLYQIWCFVEMKNMVQSVLNKTPEEINLAEILIDNFTIQLRTGRKSRVSFKKDNGDIIELFHELNYSSAISDNTISYTGIQKPDIVLRITKNDLFENQKFTYLFDAKYRIDDNVDQYDHPPVDAINQMHRYRDAIYYLENQHDSGPKKEVIGAYVLFPGADDIEDVSNLDFQRSIKEVNIGAYPLVPGANKNKNNTLLKDFLNNILTEKDSLSFLHEDIIPYKAMKYEDPDALVLVGFTSSDIQREYFKNDDAKIYHLPINKTSGQMNTIRHLDKLKYFCPVIDGVSTYYEITDIKVIPRKEIFEKGHALFKENKKSYYVFTLRSKKRLKKTIETAVGGNRIFRYARLSELMSSNTINDFNKTTQEK